MKRFVRILAHLVFILALASITLMILNVYNPLMGFTTSDYSRAVFLALYVLAAVLAVLVFSGPEKKQSRGDEPPREKDI